MDSSSGTAGSVELQMENGLVLQQEPDTWLPCGAEGRQLRWRIKEWSFDPFTVPEPSVESEPEAQAPEAQAATKGAAPKAKAKAKAAAEKPSPKEERNGNSGTIGLIGSQAYGMVQGRTEWYGIVQYGTERETDDEKEEKEVKKKKHKKHKEKDFLLRDWSDSIVAAASSCHVGWQPVGAIVGKEKEKEGQVKRKRKKKKRGKSKASSHSSRRRRKRGKSRRKATAGSSSERGKRRAAPDSERSASKPKEEKPARAASPVEELSDREMRLRRFAEQSKLIPQVLMNRALADFAGIKEVAEWAQQEADREDSHRSREKAKADAAQAPETTPEVTKAVWEAAASSELGKANGTAAAEPDAAPDPMLLRAFSLQNQLPDSVLMNVLMLGPLEASDNPTAALQKRCLEQRHQTSSSAIAPC
eukprot:Skav212716  [mRNA]  locus=scaffold113:470118:484303:- [translate_table: standard]